MVHLGFCLLQITMESGFGVKKKKRWRESAPEKRGFSEIILGAPTPPLLLYAYASVHIETQTDPYLSGQRTQNRTYYRYSRTYCDSWGPVFYVVFFHKKGDDDGHALWSSDLHEAINPSIFAVPVSSRCQVAQLPRRTVRLRSGGLASNGSLLA